MSRASDLAQITNDAVWRWTFSRWRGNPAVSPGYTLLAPVPGDLPAFLHLVLAVASRQDPAHRVETVVVPDFFTPEFEAAFRRARSLFDIGPIRLVRVGRRGTAIQKAFGAGSSNLHFMQIYYGALTTRSTHVLLHDADLFVKDPGFFRDHYQECLNRDLACLGVAPAWDKDLRATGGSHVVATWELMFEMDWLQSFPPWQHRPHFAKWQGRCHGFDTMLYPQAETEPVRCGLKTHTEGLIHFNYVLGEYRSFQRQRAHVYEDHKFLILLIRLLHDAYDGPDTGDEARSLPSIQELVKGLSKQPGRVSYRFPGAPESYGEFRGKVEQVLEACFLSSERAARILEELRPFDAAFA